MSTRIQQKFTYYCSNALAVRNAEDNKADLALRLMGDNDHEFKTEKLSSQEVDDGCAVSYRRELEVERVRERKKEKKRGGGGRTREMKGGERERVEGERGRGEGQREKACRERGRERGRREGAGR